MGQIKALQQACNIKAYNAVTGIYRTKETKEMILIPGQLIEKERIIVMITQNLVWKSKKDTRQASIQLEYCMLYD